LFIALRNQTSATNIKELSAPIAASIAAVTPALGLVFWH